MSGVLSVKVNFAFHHLQAAATHAREVHRLELQHAGEPRGAFFEEIILPNPACPSPKPAETMPSPRSSIAVARGGYRLPTQFCTTARRSLIPAASPRSGRRFGFAYIFIAFVEAVAVGGRVTAPAAFARHERREIEVKGLADARGGRSLDKFAEVVSRLKGVLEAICRRFELHRSVLHCW
jgi:hypothetical protein